MTKRYQTRNVEVKVWEIVEGQTPPEWCQAAWFIKDGLIYMSSAPGVFNVLQNGHFMIWDPAGLLRVVNAATFQAVFEEMPESKQEEQGNGENA